jgi:dienelactone hydrolase
MLSTACRRLAIILWFSSLFAVGPFAAENSERPALPRGELVPSVTCLEDPEFSYALYLPSAYTPERDWPVIFAFSPGANGATPVRLLLEAAEQYGYIVIGSNDSRNGPWEPIHAAQRALRREARERFAIDSRRSYATGFSGGSRAAFGLALQHPRAFAGVILCGAVFTGGQDLRPNRKLAVYGLVGDADLNYPEHLRAERELPGQGFSCWQEVFPGRHQWPTPARYREAVEFLQYDAMRRKLIPMDRDFVRRIASQRLASARSLESQGRTLLALRTWRQTTEAFAGLEEATLAGREVERLAAAPETKKLLALEEELVSEIQALNDWRDRKVYPEAVERLQKVSGGGGPNAERARLALFHSSITLVEMGMQHHQAGKPENALAFFRTASWVCPDNVASFYDAACAAALTGDREGALQLLAEAADRRFNDPELLASDPDLQSLRTLPAFAEVQKKVAGNAEQGLSPPAYWVPLSDLPGRP